MAETFAVVSCLMKLSGLSRYSPYCRGGAGFLSPFDFFRYRVWVWEQKPEIWGIIFRLKPGDKGNEFISRAKKRIYRYVGMYIVRRRRNNKDGGGILFARLGSQCFEAFNYVSVLLCSC